MTHAELSAGRFPHAALARCFAIPDDRDRYAILCLGMRDAPPTKPFAIAALAARGPVLNESHPIPARVR